MKIASIFLILIILALMAIALIIDLTPSRDFDLSEHQLWVDSAESVVTRSYGYDSDHEECGMPFLIVIFTFPALSLLGTLALTGDSRNGK